MRLDLKRMESGCLGGLRLPFFLFYLMRLNYSRADADLQPACCSNSEAKLSTNAVTLFATDPIRSCIDPAIHISFSPLFRSPFPYFSSAPFDEWLCFLGQMTAQ